MRFSVLLFSILLVEPTWAQTNACSSFKSATTAITGRAGAQPIRIYPGEAVTVLGRTKNKKHLKIQVGSSHYFVDATSPMTRLDSTKCSINMCVGLRSGDSMYTAPNRKRSTVNDSSGVYPVVTVAKSWYRVQMGDRFFWMMAPQVRTQKMGCTESLPTLADTTSGTSSSSGKNSQWYFGVEAGYLTSVGGDALKNLVTPIPPSTDNVNSNDYASPFIEKIMDGTGWYLGATVEMPLFWSLRNKIALGYKTRSLEMARRPNPHDPTASFITYDELARDTVANDFSFVYATTTIKHQGWTFFGLLWQPGLLLGVDYTLDDFFFEYRVAPQKLTPKIIESGYQQIEMIYGPRLDIQYGVFVLGITAFLTDYGMEPSLSLGVQF